MVAATARRVGPALRWWEAAAYGAVLSVAAVMRLWDLGARAMHHDESLHSFYSWGLANGSGYTHIPMMHGPFQFEANAAVFFIAGDGDYTARLLYALVGTGLVALPLLLRSRLGRLGSLLASVMLAFSPAMLYFSRFARNDILMAAWTLGLVICLWRYVDEGRNRYLYFAAALLALAFATKETAYLVTAILGLFLILLVTPGNWRGDTEQAGLPRGVAARRRWADTSGAMGRIPARREPVQGFASRDVPHSAGDALAPPVVGADRRSAGHRTAPLVEPCPGRTHRQSNHRGSLRRRAGHSGAGRADPAGPVCLLGLPVAVVGVVALCAHLLRRVGSAVYDLLHQLHRRRRVGRLAVAGVLDSPSRARRGVDSPGSTTS